MRKGTPRECPFCVCEGFRWLEQVLDLLDQHIGWISLGDESVGHFERFGRKRKIRGQENNGNPRSAATHFRSHVSPIQVWHVVVEYHQIDMVLVEDSEPFW